MKLVILALAMLTVLSSKSAHASGLFYDSCVQGEAVRLPNPPDHHVSMGETQARLYLAGYSGRGLTCEDLKSAQDLVQIVRMVLMPAELAIVLSGSSAMLTSELATLGLAMSNPAVLGVTVIGATGVSVFYIVMKAKLAECEKVDRLALKSEILKELESQYGMQATSKTNLEIKK